MRVVSIVLAAAMAWPLHAQDARQSQPVGAPSSVYTLRPGDVVRTRIWREPDLSGDYPVDESGIVNFPLVGSMNVMNETRASLHERLTAAYKVAVQNLSMDVILLRRIPVVGAVRTPGLYAVEPSMTVADALALAGGSTLAAEDTKIGILRNGKPMMQDLDPSAVLSALELRPGDQLYVPPRNNFLTRNPWVPGTIIQSVVTIVATIIATHR